MFMILATFRMIIPPEKHGEVSKILTRTSERTRVEHGCISCHFYSDLQDKRGVVLEEVWKTNDDLVHHLRSDDFRDVLLVVEIALEAPEILFSNVIPENGMETIEKVRGCAR
jgi:quinol monooxygenase YgiN